jgi:hypothetical protein
MLRWQKFSRFGTRVVGLWETLLPVKRWNTRCATTSKRRCIASSPAIVQSAHHCNIYLHKPTNLPLNESHTRESDPFAAQLIACRDQGWWNQPPLEDDVSTPPHLDTVSAGGDVSYVDITLPKRSLSIREIRQRMDSDRGSMASSTSSGSYEFESGLKFLETKHGGWEDMEMFIE